MKKVLQIKTTVLGWFIILSIQYVSAQNWPQWRGPLRTGAAPSGNPPVEWSTEKNIRWKTRLTGTGYSTPAVWGDNIFVTAAVSTESGTVSGGILKATQPVKFLVMAVDRRTGKVKWEHLAREEVPHEPRNHRGAWATASPVTDGERVYAFFGSRGLYCYAIEGRLIWEKDFGDMDTHGEMGEGSSPALFEDRLIINWDHYGQDFIVALDAPTGKEIWRKKRDERISWTTPLIVEEAGRVHVIVVAEEWIQSYDITDGEMIWKVAGTQYNNISTPVAADGIVYVGSGLHSGEVRAIRLDGARGDITGSSSILWSFNKYIPYIPSPLIQGNLLYFLKDRYGFLTCLDVATGRAHYSNVRLDGIRHIFTSPVGVQDRVYILGHDGVTLVIRHGPELKVLAKNILEDKFDASPVIVDNEIYLRGYQYLYCISSDGE